MVSSLDYADLRARLDQGELRKGTLWSAVDQAARSGHAEAQFTLAYRYYKLYGSHYRKVRFWLEKAAASGHPQATAMLNELNEEAAQARSDLTTRAQREDSEAQLHLAHLLATGFDGLPIDLAESRHWFEAAAQQGQASAQVHLALMLVRGEGGPVQTSQALHWLQQAAASADPDIAQDAARLLADLSLTGPGSAP